MSPLVYLAMFGWIPFTLYLFSQYSQAGKLGIERAVVLSFIGAWLFLPEIAFPLPGLPDYTKLSATCYGILLATIIFDVQRFRSFRPGWLDLPMAIWCVSPVAASLTNNLGLYDGLSAMLTQIMTWGIPYFLGRIYFNNLAALRVLAKGIVMGGLIYVPLCLIEVRLSPQLHRWVYGFHQHSFAQTIRYGGFRPTVFMEHGLMVGIWMMAATLIAVWLWQTGVLKRLWNIPMGWLVVALVLTFVLLKSTGAYVYLALGLGILFLAYWLRTSLPLMVLMGVMSIYLYLGTTGSLTAQQTQQLVNTAALVTNTERSQSLQYRLQNEQILADKARSKMLFGWGGWGRSRVYDSSDRDVSVTDSLWIIAFGTQGLVGVISLTAALLLPVLMFFWQSFPARLWAHPQVAPAAVLAVVLALYMLDCLLNAMINPVFVLISGSITGLVLRPWMVTQLNRREPQAATSRTPQRWRQSSHRS